MLDASAASQNGTKARCPVCGRAAGSQLTCSECKWTLRSALRAGPVTPSLRQEFDQRLSQAQCAWDTRFAVLLSPTPDRYAALIRGGPPDAGQWALVRAAAESAGRATVSDQVLRDILSAVLRAAPVRGTTQPTTAIVEIDPDGITVTEATIDECGSPKLHRTTPTKRWGDLIPQLATTADELRFQLAGRVHSLDEQALDGSIRRAVPAVRADRVVVVCRPANWKLLARITELTLASRAGQAVTLTGAADIADGGLPATSLVRAGPVTEATAGGSLLDGIACGLPLLRTYNAMLAKLNPKSGQLTIELTPLFRAGDRPGTTAALSLCKAPGNDGAATLVVVASGGERDELLTAVSVPSQTERRYQVKAVLVEPGNVRFTEPSGIDPDTRPWRETLASVPSELSVPSGPVDLVCAIELGGAPDGVKEPPAVKSRKRLVAELLSLLESDYPDPDLVRVAVIGCVDHVFSPGREHTPVLKGAPLGPIASARSALRRLLGVEITNVDAAPLEELLQEASAQLARSAGQGRSARVLLVGGRPPHPYPQLWANACPERIKWESKLTELVQLRRARCVAVCDQIPARPELARVWRQLGREALRELDDTSAWQIGEDLGVLARSSQRIPIPLAD